MQMPHPSQRSSSIAGIAIRSSPFSSANISSLAARSQRIENFPEELLGSVATPLIRSSNRFPRNQRGTARPPLAQDNPHTHHGSDHIDLRTVRDGPPGRNQESHSPRQQEQPAQPTHRTRKISDHCNPDGYSSESGRGQSEGHHDGWTLQKEKRVENEDERY